MQLKLTQNFLIYPLSFFGFVWWQNIKSKRPVISGFIFFSFSLDKMQRVFQIRARFPEKPKYTIRPNPVPRCPDDWIPVSLGKHARTIYLTRYCLKPGTMRGDEIVGKDNPETEKDCAFRVAHCLARVEATEELQQIYTKEFYGLLARGRAHPNSPTYSGAGTPLGQLSACFVLAVPDDLEGICKTQRDACLIQQRGGGNGFNFSRLRRKGALIKGSGGKSTGPVGFMRAYDKTFGEIAQGGTRRGANMAMLMVDHADIREFIQCKKGTENVITNFNISVCITDEFLAMVKRRKAGEEFTYPLYDPIDGEVDRADPLEIWNMIRDNAASNGEPGVWNIDAANRKNPLPNRYTIEATNPCVSGETWVMTSDGPRQVKSILGKPVELLANGVFHESSVQGFFQTGVENVIEIQTHSGYTIEVTSNHLMRKVTKFTRYVTDSEWISAGDLQVGDKLVLGNNSSTAMEWDGDGTRGHGYLIGSIIGDGCFSTNGAFLMVWGDGEGSRSVRDYIQSITTNELGSRLIWRNYGDKWIMHAKEVTILAELFGFSKGNKAIGAPIEKASSEFYIGFLQGFFDCDGCVQGKQEKGVSIRLSQSDLPRLQGVQRMLQRLGIISTIYTNRRPEHFKEIVKGRISLCKPQHELVIAGSNLEVYADRIGFVNVENIEKLRSRFAAYKRTLNRERFVDTIKSITASSEKTPVYDVHIPQEHAFDANGFYIHNCGKCNPNPHYITHNP